MPGVSELAQGKVKVNDLLEIDLKDLLGRESVESNKDLFEKNRVGSSSNLGGMVDWVRMVPFKSIKNMIDKARFTSNLTEIMILAATDHCKLLLRVFSCPGSSIPTLAEWCNFRI